MVDPYSTDPRFLVPRIAERLQEKNRKGHRFPDAISSSIQASAVLFILGRSSHRNGQTGEPCLILNKRSVHVRQSGDLCFPGGRFSRSVDGFLSRLLRVPGSPLARWQYWPEWRTGRPTDARRLSLLFAAALRESFEEMHVNPFSVQFLGPLPPQQLLMFQRTIYPMVVWIPRQRRFLPNWEVEKIIRIPLSHLFEADRYAAYRLESLSGSKDYPCFVHDSTEGEEVLWGATYYIVAAFLKLIFDFSAPPLKGLRVISGALEREYFQSLGKRG